MEEQKHSGLGIASIIISILSAIAYFLILILSAVIVETTLPWFYPDSIVLIDLSVFAVWGALLVALGLGIGGLFQKGRKKIFAILGIMFAAATLTVSFFLTILGLLIG
jgi:hypothetical protein